MEPLLDDYDTTPTFATVILLHYSVTNIVKDSIGVLSNILFANTGHSTSVVKQLLSVSYWNDPFTGVMKVGFGISGTHYACTWVATPILIPPP